jgi:cytochrome d ubiquinol oxidase subunit I
MHHAGAIIGMPFSLEGFAFFTEAIFLGLYLYGWKRLSPGVHWISGVLVAVSGILSGLFVVTANGWMNTPVGFELVNGEFTSIDPIAAMLNPSAFHEALHMILAAFVATGFAVAGIHAYFLLREGSNEFHRAAFRIAAGFGCIAIPLQVLSGDLAAGRVARLQPAKLAAMEAHYHTRRGAPLIIAGLPNSETMTHRFAVEIPYGLSLLVARDPNAEVPGLDRVPRDQWPNVRVVHWCFDAMVGCGIAMLILAIMLGVGWFLKKDFGRSKWLLRAFVGATPFGFIAIETGWMVTELGRQPWVIYGIMRTRDAVTPMPGLVVPFTLFTLVYLFLSVMLVFLLRRQFLQTAPEAQGETHAT